MEDGKNESGTRRGFARWKTTAFITRPVAKLQKAPARSASCRGLCTAPYAGWAMRAAKFAQALLYESILARECLFVGGCESGGIHAANFRSPYRRNSPEHCARVEVAARAPFESAGGMQHRWGRDRDRCSNLHHFMKCQDCMIDFDAR